jgi:hypothetical protein
MKTKRKATVAITAPTLPAAGQRIGVVCGPGEFPHDHAGTVLCIVEDRWGSHALVLMDEGHTQTCHGMNSGPGIGWHAL